MNRTQFYARRLALLAFAWMGSAAGAADASRPGMVDLGAADARLKGFQAPAGFRLELVADDGLIASPTALAFDDAGRLLVAESVPGGRTFDVVEAVTLADGSTLRLHRRRKATADQVKRLVDTDGDGRFDKAEVALEGVEQPTALLWHQGGLLVAAGGRLERWDDGDGDDRLETRSVLVDGFGAVDGRGITGLTLAADGYLYIATGDNETHAFTPGGTRVDLARTGGVFRCRPDGTDLTLHSAGYRDPRGGVAFGAAMQATLIDDDGADGSKLAGVRMIQPTEHADYGWRTLPGPTIAPDPILGDTLAERPGKLGGYARLAGSAPADFLIYNGTGLPDACRGLILAVDPARHSLRGFKVAAPAGQATLSGETTLLAADDERFRPVALTLGADATVYILDARDPGLGTEPSGRIYRLSAVPEPAAAAPAANANKWSRITALEYDPLLPVLFSPDFATAERALRELVDRGPRCRPVLLGHATNPTMPLHVRLLGIQGARQFWDAEVEAAMVALLADPVAEVRRLAAQALAWEPKHGEGRLVAKLLERLEDPDVRVVREVALAVGRHAAADPRQPGAILLRWLYAHPQADRTTRDAVLRGLERLGDVGVDEVALAVRTKSGTERAEAVRQYGGFRSAHAAEELLGLIKVPDLAGPERAALIRLYADFAPDLAVATTGLVEWMVKHPEVEPAVKLAALETCRLVGNPASSLVLLALDDEDEPVRIAATNFAALTRPPGAVAKLTDRVGDGDRSDLERLAAVRGLRRGGAAAFPALDAAYLGAESPALRRAALRSMADTDRDKALPALTSTLSGPDPQTRREAITILGETPAGALAVGRAYLDRTLGRDELPAVLRALRPHEGREVRQVADEVRRDATQGASALAASAVRLRAVESGNPWAGLEVFSRASTRCASCHQVGGRGGKGGPSLDLDAHRLAVDKLIDAIQHPSREIKPGYEPARLALANTPEAADAAAGRKPKPAAPLAGVDRVEIATDPAKRAAMPTGLDLDLTPQELADLVAFLLDAPAQAVVRAGGPVAVDRWVVAGPFAAGADSLRLPLDRVEAGKALAGQGGRTLGWLPIVAAPGGRINLAGLVGSEPGRAYAATEVRTANPQAAWLYGSTRGAARVYLNGAKVLDLPDRSATPAIGPDAAASDGPTELARLTLKPGVNCLIVAVDSPVTGDPTATFRLATTRAVEVRSPKN